MNNTGLALGILFSLSGALMSKSLLANDSLPHVAVKQTEAFGKTYATPGPVTSDLAQIIYYRDAKNASEQGAANIYVDREFNTALIPGGYTAFCVKPGVHALGAYLKDSPEYKGKKSLARTTELKGGNTYYFKVDEQGENTQQEISSMAAEQQLKGLREQVELLNRASTIQACNYQYVDYVLSGDVLFSFGKYANADIKEQGVERVQQIASEIRKTNGASDLIVIGHTDPIGRREANLSLGLKRAQTVRNILISEGIPAANIRSSSVGSDEPVGVDCQHLAGNAKRECYAPERRVVIRSYKK